MMSRVESLKSEFSWAKIKHCLQTEKESLAKLAVASFLTPFFIFNSGVGIFTPEFSEDNLGKCTGNIEIPADDPGRINHCAMWLTSTPGIALGRALNNH